MAAADVQAPPPEPSPGVPDYLASPNAVFGDAGVEWRYGKAPDYSKTRKVWEEGKKSNHAAGSLPQLVENLVKNWEVEASFKPRLQDWRTIDHSNYSFAMNGGPPQTAEHMLKVGTYNAIIAPNEFYSPANSDFASSHKTFKRMMPTFAWEVLEVYSGPPTVAFKWRHWGEMKNDYVGFNDKGEKVVAKAHGGSIDITGITVATVDVKVRLQSVNTYYDPMEMFRQIAPHGIVNKTVMSQAMDDRSAALDADGESVPADKADNDGIKIAQAHNQPNGEHSNEPAPEDVLPKHISNSTGLPADAFVPHQGADKSSDADMPAESANEAKGALAIAADAAANGTDATIQHPASNFKSRQPTSTAPLDDSPTPALPSNTAPPSITSSAVTGDETARITSIPAGQDESSRLGVHDAIDEHLESSAAKVHPHDNKNVEEAARPAAGEAVAVPAGAEETRLTMEEMSRISPGECPFLMNRE